MKNTDVAIVGMSCYFPGANTIEEFWNNLINGIDSITDAPDDRIQSRFFECDDTPSIDRFYFSKGGFVTPIEIDPLQYGILPIAASGIDPDHLIALRLVDEALKDAQVYEKKISLTNSSFVLGKGNYAGLAALRLMNVTHLGAQIEYIVKYLFPDLPEEEIKKIKKDYQSHQGRIQADTAAGVMPNLVVSLVANKFDFQGPAYTLDAACASSLLAVEHSVNLLLSGQCDLALAGGMHLGQSSTFWSVFNLIGAASHKQKIAPFSEEADGLLIGEGAGIVVLKKLEKAIADNDRIYAVIKGCGTCSDGGGVSVMAPSTKGQVMALKTAWDKAGMNPERIGYVETHGTATQMGDRTEIATLTEFFGDKSAPPALLGSAKSNVGHAMPAAGIVGLIKTVLSLYHKKIPPTLHCEKPMKAMFESRFMPVQKLTEWEGEKYPLVAAVNAFGFGGINTHVILEAHSESPEIKRINEKKKLLKDSVISLSAQTKEALIKKLENKEYTVSQGDYRLVIFNPTKERIDRAKILIEKDKPWKGRLDIWFSNQPLFKEEGAKVAFMFTGFDPGTEMEMQSISDYYEIPFKQVDTGKDKLLGHAINHFYRSKLIDLALKKMGLIPDMNIGHSVGEWNAIGAAGYVTPDSIEEVFETYDPEEFKIIDVFYVAVGCGYDKIKSWCEKIPELYLANDNCPSQILMAGRSQTVEILVERLKKEQIYYHILPYSSGYHSPLFPEESSMLIRKRFMDVLEVQNNNIPVWSATTLEPYPTTAEGLDKLFFRQLKETVRFRELIEKLYEQEKVQIFVQIGIGNLCSFVEDILREKPISTILTLSSSSSGIEQFRRIVALLFIEGKLINKELLGIKEVLTDLPQRAKVELSAKVDYVKEFPQLKTILEKRHSGFLTTPAIRREKLDDPILQEASNNLNEIAILQENILELYKEKIRRKPLNSTFKREKDENRVINPGAIINTNSRRPGTAIEKEIRITLEEHPYLMDHMVVRQPENWPNRQDLNPVVPFAMTIELLCEKAQELLPGTKILKLSSAGVLKWIPVSKPFFSQLTGAWKSENCVFLSIPGYANADITLGEAFPPVPKEYAGEIELGNNIMPRMPEKKEIYRYSLFHGPKYQSIIDIVKITERGLQAHIHKTEGKGSLLDNLGQLLGIYCHMVLDVNQTTFPMSVDEVYFYQDIQDQSGVFEYTLVVKEMKDEEAISDVVIKRNKKVWCIVKGWHNRRFDYPRKLMNVLIRPKEFMLAMHLAPNVFYYYNTQKRASGMDFLYERYLNFKEREHYNSLYLNKAREYLISRVAVKDGIRKYIQKDENEDFIYPIEIDINYDENGKPGLPGDRFKGIELSIAHKGTEAVCIVSDKPVGIDIEQIENRSEEFKKLAFTDRELSLLSEKENEAEWVTRFWVAKESYGKMLGLGLQGNPKQYEVEEVEGENIKIRNVNITTVKHRDNFIVGWTQN